MPPADAVVVEEVAKRYRGRRGVQALRGVSLSVKEGEIYGLLGRNGAGKTTLVKILLDIVRPSTGGTSLLGRSSRSARARAPVGYLPEDHRLPEYRTAAATLDFYAMLSGVDRRTRARRSEELLELVGLKEAAKRKVRTFSKGMKQRLGLAQAMIHEPRVIFLDEPTDGVDPVGRKEIRDVLLRLKAEGRTVFLNSHLLSEVEQVCDRVGILEQGILVREGSIDELTQGEGGYALSLVPPPTPPLLAQLQEFATAVRWQEGKLELQLEREEDLDRVVDQLRAARCSIRALVPRRSTLEQVFLELLDNVEGGEE